MANAMGFKLDIATGVRDESGPPRPTKSATLAASVTGMGDGESETSDTENSAGEFGTPGVSPPRGGVCFGDGKRTAWGVRVSSPAVSASTSALTSTVVTSRGEREAALAERAAARRSRCAETGVSATASCGDESLSSDSSPKVGSVGGVACAAACASTRRSGAERSSYSTSASVSKLESSPSVSTSSSTWTPTRSDATWATFSSVTLAELSALSSFSFAARVAASRSTRCLNSCISVSAVISRVREFCAATAALFLLIRNSSVRFVIVVNCFVCSGVSVSKTRGASLFFWTRATL